MITEIETTVLTLGGVSLGKNEYLLSGEDTTTAEKPEKEMSKRKVRLNEKESVSTFIVCIHSDQHDRMRQQR